MAAAAKATRLPDDAFELESVARQKLIVALDVSTIDEARKLVETLGDEVVFYKVGLGLQLAGGDHFAKELKAQNKRVFLDYKYYDIDKTIENAVARAAEIGIDFLTVHGVANILKSAVKGRGNASLKILCVTVLTSMDAADIQEMGFSPTVTVEELVLHRAKKALAAGVDGVIASAREVEKIKAFSQGKLMIVTPGIRPADDDIGDQKRVATPFEAVKAGADYLVVGRPITENSDPRSKAAQIVREMAAALREMQT